MVAIADLGNMSPIVEKRFADHAWCPAPARPMMIAKTLKVELNPDFLDATDALAIALCHHYQLSNPLAAVGGKTDWKKFIEANPGRIKK